MAAFDHTVQSGECLHVIARRHGLRWRAVWNHPRNSALRARRGNPDELVPGDIVHIPENLPGSNTKSVECATDRQYFFRVKASHCLRVEWLVEELLELSVDSVSEGPPLVFLEVEGEPAPHFEVETKTAPHPGFEVLIEEHAAQGEMGNIPNRIAE